jgi:hypothetical protein
LTHLLIGQIFFLSKSIWRNIETEKWWICPLSHEQHTLKAPNPGGEANQDYTMLPSAKETKRKREGEQVLSSSHKRKKREAGGASAEKTANQGEDSTKHAKSVDAFSTGMTARRAPARQG